MRKCLLTAALACLVCVPVLLAQPGAGMFGRGALEGVLLTNAEVQKELKLTDDQKKDLKAAGDEMREAMAKAREDMDREGFQKATEAYGKAVAKVKDGLKDAQKKRLLGIQAQLAEKNKSVAIFADKEVAKAMKLTDKQKEVLSEYEKDAKELREELKGDFSKFREIGPKIQKLGSETYAKVTDSLSDDQKTAWKELKGDKFDVSKINFGGGGRQKGKGKKSKDDA